MEVRDGEEVPDQHLGAGEEDPQDIDEEPNQDNVPPVREGTDPKRGRPKGSTRLSKEEILRKLASRPKVTSTPRVKAVSIRRIREDPRPLGSIDIASLIKDPTYPEPALETADLGTRVKTRQTKSVKYTDYLDSESEMDEDLDLTRVPSTDTDFYPREPGQCPSRTPIPAPARNPSDAFKSGIGRERVLEQEGFSSASLAVIDRMTKEREDIVELMFKVHTDNLTTEESDLMTKYLTPDQVVQIDNKVMEDRRNIRRHEVDRVLGLPIPLYFVNPCPNIVAPKYGAQF
jgi:hypothetical protein